MSNQVPKNPIPDHPRYEMIAHVNRGRHGFVVRARDKKTNTDVAIKFLDRPSATTKYVEREIINQYKLCHPHVIALYDVFLTPQYLALVLEYANFGDLHTYVMTRGGLAEEQARWFFQQLILAVDFCHRMGISNRDIKLENILLAGDSQPLLKLADFGFSKSEHGQSAPSTRVGTIMYMAPEVLSFSAKDGSSYDARQADVWSCGVVLYAMLSGRYPFRNEADLKLGKAQAMRAIINRVLQKQVPPLTAITPSCQDLLQKLLEHKPEDRCSIEEVIKHPWFAEDIPSGTLTYNSSVIKTISSRVEDQDQVLAHIRKVLSELNSCSR